MNVIWAGSYPAMAIAQMSFSASLLTLIRLGTGTLVMVPFLWHHARHWSGRSILQMMFLGVIGFSLPLVLQTQGLKDSTPAMAAISIALEPLITSLMGRILLKQRLSPSRRWALVIAAFGAWAVAGFPRPGVRGYTRGDLLLLFSIMCFGVYNVYSSSLSRQLNPGQAVAGTFLGGFLGVLPIWFLSGVPWPRTIPTSSLLATLYLAFIGTALAYFLWMRTVARISVAAMALFLYLQPVLGVVLSQLITPTHVSGSFLVGSAAVLVALYMGRDKEKNAISPVSSHT